MYYVYMLTNRWHNVLYTGMTDSIEGRLSDHRNRRLEGFTKRYNCTKLVYVEEFDNSAAAAIREKQIKGWKRARKNALIASVNPDWSDLAPQGILRFAQDLRP
jgi:putative endonuclease